MNRIKIKCPAKINLTLEVVNKRPDGFHNIKSIMQMINLYDYLDIKIEPAEETKIILYGNSNEIPYNKQNLVYKACDLFLKTADINNLEVNINIEKNIPISAGLAGGSTDGAGTVFGLNKLLKTQGISEETLDLVKYHHQNLQHSGYPALQNNDKISEISVQIISTADKYSALRESRVYRGRLSRIQSLLILYKEVLEGKIHKDVYKALFEYAVKYDKAA